MINGNICKKAGIILSMLFFGAIIGTGVNGLITANSEMKTYGTGVLEVWVDDDYYEGGYNDGHTWHIDAFDNIQDGIDNVDDYGLIHVKEGNYAPFKIEGRNGLMVKGEGNPVVTGNQIVTDQSYPADVNNVVFVDSSDLININGLEIIGTNPSGRHFSVFYQNAAGIIEDCEINADNVGNMNALAIRAITNSNLSVKKSLIENYGRIGIYAKTGTTLVVSGCELIGQSYPVPGQVNYGIEIEGLDEACNGEITSNNIHGHDNTAGPQWSSAGIIIDTFRNLGPDYNCKESTVTIENNEIYDNLHGVQMVPNEGIVVVYNKFHDNNYGAVSDPYYDGSTYIDIDMNAINNWWGDPSGPYHPVLNPNGLGDQVYDYVLFDPWTTSISAGINCEGSLSWVDVVAGSTLNGVFTVENIGYIYSELNWAVTEWPTWGNWDFQPSSDSGLTPEMGMTSVKVTVTSPNDKNKEFHGNIRVTNMEDPSDYQEMPVYLKTFRQRMFLSNKLTDVLFENHHILGLLLQFERPS
jgi:hypothetical protein